MLCSRFVAAVFVAVLVPVPGACAISRGAQSLDARQIDEFITREMKSNRIPGVALAITHGGQVIWLRGYGESRKGEPVTSQTQFLIASISKSITALATMQLVESGSVGLDAPVQKYLPDFTTADRTAASHITIRHLLNQTSGMADAGFPEGWLSQPATIQQRVASLRSARLVTPPGVQFHYFNPNYAVLAHVVEVAAGEPFGHYLREHIFEPLRMLRTDSAVTSTEARARATNLAQGHLMAFGVAFPCPEMPGYLGGSGGVISTAEDMARYLAFQNSDGTVGTTRLLSPEGMHLLHTPPQNIASHYGMGWFVTERNGQTVIEHNGILSVFYADAVLLPQNGYGIALLYNVESLPSTILAFPEIEAGIMEILTAGKAAPQPFPVAAWGVMISALTAIAVTLGTRSLIRQTRERRRAFLLLHFAWWLLPGALLLGLPWVVLWTAGRAFSYRQLFRSMPDLVVWLGASAALGVVNSGFRVRALVLARHRSDRGSPAPHAGLCGGAGVLRQRLFAWMLARFGARLETRLAPYKLRLFRGLSGTLVEIGPGVGANLPYFSVASKWIGVEPNRFMHQRLRQRARELGLNAEVKHGAAESLPVPDNTADAVISTLVLCSVADQRRTLKEVLRVLKPGGKLLFLEHVAAPAGSSLRRLQKWLNPLWSRLGDGCNPDRETWVALQEAGFSKLSFEQLTMPVPVVSPHIAGIAVKSHG